MPTASILSRSLVLIGLLALGACKTTVIGGGDGGGGDGNGGGGVAGGGGEGGTGGTVIVGPPNAIAEYAYMTSTPPDPGTGSSSSGGTGVDPNTLYVRIGNYGVGCGNTTSPFSCTNPPSWGVSIGLPPALQAPGVYALDNPAIISMASVSGGGESPGECWGGGGSFVNGTVEVVSNDGAAIVVRLAGTDGLFPEFAADGEWTAPICQWGLD